MFGVNVVVNIIDISENYAEAFAKNHKTSYQRAFQYVASFPPSTPAIFINMYSKEGDVVLDPFSGKGTCPLQALVMNRVGIGNDMSKVAYTYTYSRVHSIPFNEILESIEELKRNTRDIVVNPYNYEALLYMYHFDTLMDIIRVREYLMDKYDDKSMFLKAHICGILYGSSPMDLTNGLPGVIPLNLSSIKKHVVNYKDKPVYKDLFVCLKDKIKYAMRTGVPRNEGKVFCGNVLDLSKKMDKDSVNLVVTSPPYVDLVTYGEVTWIMQWFLGEDYRVYDKKTKDVGSCSGVEESYFSLMKKTLELMYELLKDNSVCVFVVGGSRSKVDKLGVFDIPMKFIKVGREVGFNIDELYTREFRSSVRSIFKKEIRESKGINYQDVLLIFKKGEPKCYMPFLEAINYGIRNIEDLDKFADINLEELEL